MKTTHSLILVAIFWLYSSLPEVYAGNNIIQNSTLKILPLGNSITQARQGRSSYRRPLYKAMVNAGYNVDFVGTLNEGYDCNPPNATDFDRDHEGHAGWSAKEVLNGRSKACTGSGKLTDWIKNYDVDVALVHLGTNDMDDNNGIGPTINRLGTIIDILRDKNPNVVVFLAQCIPAVASKYAEIPQLNAAMPALVAAKTTQQSPVILVDQYSGYSASGDNYDGTHPGNSGEQKMADRWFEAFDDHFKGNTGGTNDDDDDSNPPPSPTDAIKINFQPNSSTIPSGYLTDFGNIFGNRTGGVSYGWLSSSNFQTRQRSGSSDPRLSSLNHLQKNGNSIWEIALANGDYSITVTCGDAQYADQINNLNIEGNILSDPDGQDNFDTYQTTVSVADGRLTVSAAPGASNAKICYIDIVPVNDSEPILYALEVNNGSGSGSYESGTQVTVQADTPQSGKVFQSWTGNTDGLSSINSAQAVYTISSQNAIITATYTDIVTLEYTLTVNQGTGDGQYTEGSVVEVVADTPPSGQQFKVWTGNISGLEDPLSSSTTYSISNQDATITATYEQLPGNGESYAKINFQPSGTSTPTGYQADIGEAFSSRSGGYAYGWLSGENIATRFRSGNVEEKFRTLNHLQKGSARTWEIAVPTGTYELEIGCGDAEYTDQVNNLNVEGLQVIDADGQDNLDVFDLTVEVTDGRLTISPGNGAVNAKICYINISTVSTAPVVYILTVNEGQGSGNYDFGDVVNIAANDAPNGQEFDQWIGDIATINNVNTASAQITINEVNTTVTATFKDIAPILYSLTVNNGTGSGEYAAGASVDIQASQAPTGQRFLAWTGDISSVNNPTKSSTTLVMVSEDITVSAQYEELPVQSFNVIVNNGTGSGTYLQGSLINIVANTAPEGQEFDFWSGDVSGIDDISASSTSLIVEDADITIIANYRMISPTGCESVNISIEAESSSNERNGTTRLNNKSSASGGTVVGYIGNSPSNNLEVIVPNIPCNDEYTLQVDYISGETRSISVAINNNEAFTETVNSGSWNAISSFSRNVQLTEGTNVIRFFNSTSSGPDIDLVKLTKVNTGNTPIDTADQNPPTAVSGFLETNGEVVMEAEHFDLLSGTDPSGSSWFVESTNGNFSGTGYVTTQSSGTNASWQNATTLSYNLTIQTSGNYNVWIRRYANSNATNSAFVGLQNEPLPNIDNGSGGLNSWTWINMGRLALNTGESVFQIKRREGGYAIDKIVLRTSSDSPSGNGPQESPRNIGIPTITLISPVQGNVFEELSNIQLQAEAEDESEVARVDFYANNILIGTDSNQPYTFSWNNVTTGSYQLTAQVYDNEGNSAISNRVSIVVGDVSETSEQWSRWENTLVSSTAYSNPFQDVTVTVTYNGPNAESFSTWAFWDGGTSFKMRNAFPSIGVWTWTTTCSDVSNNGLHNQTGTVNVIPYSGTNPLMQHGFLQTEVNGKRYLYHADGTPFFWSGDTHWLATMKLSENGFKTWVDKRVSQDFTVLQTNIARGNGNDLQGNGPWTNNRWNLNFFQKLDREFDYANDNGLVLFVNGFVDLTWARGISDHLRLTKMIAARYHAHFITYSSGMDDKTESIHHSINAALDEVTDVHLITQHTGTSSSWPEAFWDRNYLDFGMIQTGHGGHNYSNATGNVFSYVDKFWDYSPKRAFVNAEAWYEGYSGNPEASPSQALQLGYSTILNGSFGYTYGVVRNWDIGTDSWLNTALSLPGGDYMKYFSKVFTDHDWWKLVPARQLVLNNPSDSRDKMSFAVADDGSLGMAYLPDNSTITINKSQFSGNMHVRWFNPKTGVYSDAGNTTNIGNQSFNAPNGSQEWLLVFTEVTQTNRYATDEVENDQRLVMYPNPVTGKMVNIQYHEPILEVKFLSLSGKYLATYKGTNTTKMKISLDHVKAKTVLMQLISKNGTATKLLTIQ